MSETTKVSYDIPFHKSGISGIRTVLGKPVALLVESDLVFNCGIYDALGNFEASPTGTSCVIKLHNLDADGSLGSQIVSASGSITGSKTLGGFKTGNGHASVTIASSSIPLSTFTGTALVRMSLWIDTTMLVQSNVLLHDFGSSIIAGGTLVFDSPPTGGTIRGWWDASNSATDIVLSGSDVVTWAAKTHVTVNNPLIDNGDNAFAGGASTAAPTLVSAGLNGLDYVRFNSSTTQTMTMAAGDDRFFSTPNGLETIMILGRVWSGTPSSQYMVAADVNTGNPRGFGFSSGRPFMNGATSLVHASTAAAGTWYGFGCAWAASGAATNRVSLSRSHQVGTWIISGGGPTIGDSSIFCCAGINFDMCEMLIVDGQMSEVDHGLVLDWFNTKWGLSL